VDEHPSTLKGAHPSMSSNSAQKSSDQVQTESRLTKLKAVLKDAFIPPPPAPKVQWYIVNDRAYEPEIPAYSPVPTSGEVVLSGEQYADLVSRSRRRRNNPCGSHDYQNYSSYPASSVSPFRMLPPPWSIMGAASPESRTPHYSTTQADRGTRPPAMWNIMGVGGRGGRS